MALKLVTRAQWGARAYRTPNGATPYSGARRGVKLHYLGTAYADRTHDRCAAYVRLLQDQHMDGNGWSDIGYSFLVCTHGYVYEGRGLKRRNSANGNTALNEENYAVCLLVGSSGRTEPTVEQLHGARDAIEHCRTNGPAGDWLGGHRDGYATSCPGDAVYAWVKKGAPRPSTSTEDPDMDKAQMFDAVWDQDRAPAPSTSTTLATNKLWKPISFLREIYDAITRLSKDVAALRAEVAELKKGN
ncbi:MAG: N-acetylmuramoyl-L-alanine amidase [Streptomyces sp.]|nr:N-acetylmuramoyl-L-alanine amidase [Streptomyces sp.]